MKLNIDTRIFNFIKDEGFTNTIDDFLWFYKDGLRMTNFKSLLTIPCKNEVDKFGLEYKTLKDRLANHQGSIISLEVSDIECLVEDDCDISGDIIKSKFVKCSFGSNVFICRKIESGMLDIALKYEKMEFKNKIIVSSKIFKKLVYKYTGLLINKNKIKVVDLDFYNGDFSKLLCLTKKKKFNGLDENKDFTLYYNDLGKANNIYKATQGDIALLEG